MTESGPRSPRSMYAFASSPRLVPSRTAARKTSPVAIFGIPMRMASLSACVPLPAPGGPSSTMIIADTGKRVGGAFGSSDRSLVSAAGRTAAESHSSLLHEAIILSEQQVLIDLRHRVERHTDHDQQRCPTEPERDVDHGGDDHRQERLKRQEQRARERDA